MADEVVLKVILKHEPNWYAQGHDEAKVSVLQVIKGPFRGRTVSLALNRHSSCDTIGVVGKSGYVVMKQYGSSWVVSAYHVSGGKTQGRGSAVIPILDAGRH